MPFPFSLFRFPFSALPLLMLLIRADHPDDAAPTDDFALVANPFD
jgi:hypothetical protein